MERFRSAAVFRRNIRALIHQEPGHFKSESRRRYMKRRVAGIQVVSYLREKVPGSICPGRAIGGGHPREIDVRSDKLPCFSDVA